MSRYKQSCFVGTKLVLQQRVPSPSPTPHEIVGASSMFFKGCTRARRENQNFLFMLPPMQSEGISSPPGTSFDPVLDVSALSAFSVIAIVFTFLMARASAVENATTKRKDATEKLRDARKQELVGGDSASLALKQLEDALKEEETLRTIIPGIRIRAPNSLQDDDKDQIRMLLKIDETSEEPKYPTISSFLELVNESKSSLTEQNGISNVSKFILGAIVVLQLFLLYILSFDPMKGSDVFQ